MNTELRTQTQNIDGTLIELTRFSVPMLHEDWHKAESLGLVFAWYEHIGPDYWDDWMIFCAPEHKETVSKWFVRYL